MNPREMVQFLRPENFEPCVFVTSSGDRYEVRHPELARVFENGTVEIAEPSEREDAHYKSWARLGYENIAAIEPLSRLDRTD